MSRHRSVPTARTTARPAARAAVVLVAVLAASLSIASPVRASWRASADSLFAQADGRYAAGAYEKAATLYGRTIDTIDTNSDPKPGSYFAQLRARSRYLMARSYERLEDWDVAIHHYTTCLTELAEVEDLVRLRLAACHAGLDDHVSAVEELRIVIDDGVDGQFDLGAMYDLATYYEDADDPDMALQWYTIYLREAGSYNERALAHYRMGRAYERRGDKEAATRSYATAVNDYPRSRHAYDAMQRARDIARDFTDRYHQGLVLYNRRSSRTRPRTSWREVTSV